MQYLLFLLPGLTNYEHIYWQDIAIPAYSVTITDMRESVHICAHYPHQIIEIFSLMVNFTIEI